MTNVLIRKTMGKPRITSTTVTKGPNFQELGGVAIGGWTDIRVLSRHHLVGGSNLMLEESYEK